MAEKVTIMVLKVDLQCHLCYKKIKKILCKFPQIRDQIYDEKKNTVTIIVVCCSPEKVRDKLCCKGGKTIKSIEIIEPPKPKPPKKPEQLEKPKDLEKPKEKLKDLDKRKDLEKPKEKPKDLDKPKDLEKPKDKPKDLDKLKDLEKLKDKPSPSAPAPAPAKAPAPAPKPPPLVPKCPEPTPILVSYPPMYPVGICCGQCYEGRNDGPCYHGYGRPVPSYDNYGYGSSGYGGNKGSYTSQCDYFSEENASGCTIM